MNRTGKKKLHTGAFIQWENQAKIKERYSMGNGAMYLREK